MVIRQWFSFTLQAHELERLRARDVGATVGRMLTATTGEQLELQCN